MYIVSSKYNYFIFEIQKKEARLALHGVIGIVYSQLVWGPAQTPCSVVVVWSVLWWACSPGATHNYWRLYRHYHWNDNRIGMVKKLRCLNYHWHDNIIGMVKTLLCAHCHWHDNKMIGMTNNCLWCIHWNNKIIGVVNNILHYIHITTKMTKQTEC